MSQKRGAKSEPQQEIRANCKTVAVLADTWSIFCYS